MILAPVIESGNKAIKLILGPCSAESPRQLEDTIVSLGELQPDLIRAGVWKPRTRPGHFQGMGEPALEWMTLLKQKYGIKFCAEVANSAHVEACLKHGVDVLWIGARTTVNPFYVQEIADALKGTKIPVMVKNPINPDIFLWMGALERLEKVGIKRLAAIHRGFSFYGNSIFRNVPRWQIALELKRQLPELQMLVDVSHISGSSRHLLEIAQIALDLNYSGIMAEIHPHPSEALSDADQQVTADFFKQNVWDRLIQRRPDITARGDLDAIISLRAKIDNIDQSLMKLVAERMKIAEQIGIIKKESAISILQANRWEEILTSLLATGKELGLSDEFVSSLIEAIHIESIQHQSKKMNQSED